MHLNLFKWSKWLRYDFCHWLCLFNFVFSMCLALTKKKTLPLLQEVLSFRMIIRMIALYDSCLKGLIKSHKTLPANLYWMSFLSLPNSVFYKCLHLQFFYNKTSLALLCQQNSRHCNLLILINCLKDDLLCPRNLMLSV